MIIAPTEDAPVHEPLDPALDVRQVEGQADHRHQDRQHVAHRRGIPAGDPGRGKRHQGQKPDHQREQAADQNVAEGHADVHQPVAEDRVGGDADEDQGAGRAAGEPEVVGHRQHGHREVRHGDGDETDAESGQDVSQLDALPAAGRVHAAAEEVPQAPDERGHRIACDQGIERAEHGSFHPGPHDHRRLHQRRERQRRQADAEAEHRPDGQPAGPRVALLGEDPGERQQGRRRGRPEGERQAPHDRDPVDVRREADAEHGEGPEGHQGEHCRQGPVLGSAPPAPEHADRQDQVGDPARDEAEADQIHGRPAFPTSTAASLPLKPCARTSARETWLRRGAPGM